MFSQDLTLSEFVCSIPICDSEADLGSILHIFHQEDCDCLAIFNRNSSWGIISSSSLLALLSQPGERLSIGSGHPRRRIEQRNFDFELGKDKLQQLIEPATVCHADTNLLEFLKALEHNYFNIGKSKYLIVDSAGKLQGKLDQDKLLRHLGSTFDQRTPNQPLSTLSIPWLKLLDNLTLPLKIETSEQKNCYENRCWQKLISHNQDKYLAESEELNVSIANWWMKKQLDALTNKEQHQQTSQIQTNDIGDFCCLGDRYFATHQPNISQVINLNIEQPLIDYADDLITLDNLHLNSSEDSPSGIRVESGKDWNYIKIPLTLELEQLSSIAQATAYWLVLAIKPSLLGSSNGITKNSSSVAAKSTVDQLLGTISHELKSPLTGIVGLSSLLSSQKLGKLNQRQAKYIELIHHSGQKLMTIVNDLIELTSLTTGKFQLKPEEIELKPLLGKLYQQVKLKSQSNKSSEADLLISTSKMQLKIEPGQEIAIADRLRLSSILAHLMLEAVQFDNSSPTAIAVEVKSSAQGMMIIVQGELTSSGVSSPEASGIVGQGVGLNLIIAKYLAQTLQGDIQSTCAATGCSFSLELPTVYFPAKNISSISTKTKRDRHNSPRNLTILSLYPETEAINASAGNNRGLDFDLKKWAEQDWSNDEQPQLPYRHRIIEADGLEQAHTLARIWQLDAIVIDGYQIINPEQYLRSLQKSEYLSALPLITLDTKTSEAANQIEGLNVYPCLLPAQCRSVKDLMQVIQIATEQ